MYTSVYLFVNVAHHYINHSTKAVFSDYCLNLYCYIHNILADMSSGPLQMFLVELRSLHSSLKTLNDKIIKFGLRNSEN